MAKLAILVYKDKYNTIPSLASLFSAIFGYDQTQAFSCAYLCYHRGEYVVKKYQLSQRGEAETCLSVLLNHGIPAEIFKL